MSGVVEVTGRLDMMAVELDTLSKALAVVERQLEPLDTFYAEALDDFECGSWDAHVKEEAKLSERAALLAKRRRLEKRIKALGQQIDAQRSILSALKYELEAIS